MRIFLIFISLFLTTKTFGQNKKKVTAILFDNQNVESLTSVDTVMKARKFDFKTTNFDVFFCNKYFHIPYYVPTDGIFKNSTKDSECVMKIYPSNVKCYEYDNKNRVIKMTINGSGTSNNFSYKYNDKSQITEITDYGSIKYLLTYNSDGTISELRKSDSIFEQRLVFIYH